LWIFITFLCNWITLEEFLSIVTFASPVLTHFSILVLVRQKSIVPIFSLSFLGDKEKMLNSVREAQQGHNIAEDRK
jgi:hypothetical protein